MQQAAVSLPHRRDRIGADRPRDPAL